MSFICATLFCKYVFAMFNMFVVFIYSPYIYVYFKSIAQARYYTAVFILIITLAYFYLFYFFFHYLLSYNVFTWLFLGGAVSHMLLSSMFLPLWPFCAPPFCFLSVFYHYIIGWAVFVSCD